MPADRPGLIHRPRLVDLLLGASDDPLIVLSAPVGYGKSTLLAQWARRDDRTFAWVSLGPQDGRVVPLFILIATAVGRAVGVPPAVFNAETPGHLGHRTGGAAPRRRTHETRRAARLGHPQHPRGARQGREGRARSTGRQPAGPRPTRGVEPSAGVAHDACQESPPRGSWSWARRISPSDATRWNTCWRSQPGTSGPDDLDDIMSSTEGWPAGVYLSLLALRRHGTGSARPSLPVAAATTAAMTSDFVTRRSPCRDATRHHPLPAQGVDPRGDVGTVVRRSPAHRGLRPAPRFHLQVEPARRPDRRRRLLVPVPHTAANGVARRSRSEMSPTVRRPCTNGPRPGGSTPVRRCRDPTRPRGR